MQGQQRAQQQAQPIDSRHRAAVLSLLAFLAWLSAGCAKHADFVNMRDDLRSMTKAQEQDRKKQEELQNRLKSIEAKLDSKPAARTAPSEPAAKDLRETESLRQRVQQLEDRLKGLESQLARVPEPRPSLPPPPAPSNGTAGEPPLQSKPARLPPAPEPKLPLPGTPDITPTSAYNLAYNDYLNGQYELAIAGFQRFLKDFPNTSLASNAQYWIGESYYSMKNYAQASSAFEQVVNDFPRSEKVPPALFKLGLVSAESGDVLKAREFLKRVIQEFSSSNEAKLARNKLAELR